MKKTALEKIEPLLQAPAFTSKEAKELGVSAALLSYYAKIGAIEKVGRGVYRGNQAKTVDDFRIEDLANSLLCVKNGVICLVSALVIYDLTEETPRQHWIAIPHQTRHRGNSSLKIIRLRNIELGKTFYKINGIKLPIFDRERTIIDAFRYLSTETALKSLRLALRKKGNEKINFEKLRTYAKILRVKVEPYLLALST